MCPPPDPNNPTLQNLKEALNSKDPASIYPVGTEIPDVWKDISAPLIILDYKNMTVDGTAVFGAVVQRKNVLYATPFNPSSNGGTNLITSSLYTWLNNGYKNNCSSDLLELAKTTLVDISSGDSANCWVWILSADEVCGYSSSNVGSQLKYYQEKTGINESTPTANRNSANTGRVTRNTSGNLSSVWLRTTYGYSDKYLQIIREDGTIATQIITTNSGALPVHFIPKN